MKLYDFHVHTKGISKCSHLTYTELCHHLKADGVDGFVLTNHYAPYHASKPYDEWLKRYVEEYYLTSAEAERVGLKAFFGIEVTLPGPRDFLIYGVKPESVLETDGMLFDYPLEELYAYAHSQNAVLIHAHPYRGGCVPADPAYIDGVEINCHPVYMDSREADVRAYAEKHGLRLSCGSDYHGDVYKAHCGVYLPDEIQTEAQIAEYFRAVQPELLTHVIDKEYAKKTMGCGVQY